VEKVFRSIGALLFAAALLSFAVVYGWQLRIPAPPSQTATPDALFDVLLFTIFALHHSVMARTGAKAGIARIVSPRLERSLYVWIASLLFLAVCWLWRPLPGAIWHIRGPGIMLIVLQLFGLILAVVSARTVGISELAGLKQPDYAKPVEFTTAGPFGIVRHPLYLGWVLIVFATPVMTMSRFVFAVISTVYLIVAIPFEERTLLESHREDYGAYQKQMRWRLIPYVW
jgi:protein-S-isoprenylcysteine O-methyltransferase Ste14